MPLYCYTHLTNTKHKTTSASVNNSNFAIRIVPFSMTVGFLIPSIVMCWPTLSGQSRQFAVSFWQNFPLWICLVQAAAQMTWERTIFLIDKSDSSKVGNREGTHSDAVKQTYSIALIVSTIIHLVASVPIFVTSLFPDMMSTQTLLALSWKSFLVPPKWTCTTQINSMGEGAWNFLRYDHYLGTMAALIWAAIAFFDVQRTKFETQTVVRNILNVVLWGLIGGPGAALLTLMSIRDFHLSERAWNSKDTKKT